MQALTLTLLKTQAQHYLTHLAQGGIPDLYGVTDGKAVGTYIEHGFIDNLTQQFTFDRGNSARGIDFPSLNVDLKVTSLKQPQSSSPFRDAKQKVYGLGYHLLVFVYKKADDTEGRVANLEFPHVVFINSSKTADFQTTKGLVDILTRDGNLDDIDAFLQERMLPLDDIGRRQLAQQIVDSPPELGYLTISNALQWRLQYNRAIRVALLGATTGVENLLSTSHDDE